MRSDRMIPGGSISMGARPPMSRPSAGAGGGIPPQPEHPAVMDEAEIWLDELGLSFSGGQLTSWTNRGTGGATFDLVTVETPSATSQGSRQGNDGHTRPVLTLSEPGTRGFITSPTAVLANQWSGEIFAACRYGYIGDPGQGRGTIVGAHQTDISSGNHHVYLRVQGSFGQDKANINIGKGPGAGAGGVQLAQAMDSEWGQWRGRYDRAGQRPSLWATRPVPQFNSVGGILAADDYWKITYFGYSWTTAQNWRGDVAELLLFNRLLTDQEAADIEDYLDLKWNTGQYGFDP